MQAADWSFAPSLNTSELLELLGDEESFLELEIASLLDYETAATCVSTADTGGRSSSAAAPHGEPANADTLAHTQLQPQSSTSVSVETSKKKSSLQRQKDESAQLKSQVVELEAKLHSLRGASRTSGAMQASTVVQTAALSLSFWRVVAQRQLHDRKQAEQENAELRTSLKEQTLLAKSLERMLRKRPVSFACWICDREPVLLVLALVVLCGSPLCFYSCC